jgi:DNA-3-methyladenine glycosylase
MLRNDFFARPVCDVARALIGVRLEVDGVGGLIIETEAYAADDPASHSFRGRTLRNAVMFGPPGHAYVYRSYGVHWCLNFTCGSGEGDAGHAVLIRALEPRAGIEQMKRRRGVSDVRLLASGPGRLTQALGISSAHNGQYLGALPFELHDSERPPEIVTGPRIGISKAVDLPWRFGLKASPFLSRNFSASSFSPR